MPCAARYVLVEVARRADPDGIFRFNESTPSVGALAQELELPEPVLVGILATLTAWPAVIGIEGGFALPEWMGFASRKAVTARENGRRHRPRPTDVEPTPETEQPVMGQRRLP